MLTLISTFGLGIAARETGLSRIISDFVVTFGDGTGKFALLCSEYLFTVVLSALIGNYGSAIIMFHVILNVL